MHNITTYTSKIKSKEERVVRQVGDEKLIEKQGLYLIKNFKVVGSTTLPIYRGIDLANDASAFVDAIKAGA